MDQNHYNPIDGDTPEDSTLYRKELSVSCLPVSALVTLLRGRGVRLDRSERPHLLNLVHSTLASSLKTVWVSDRFPEHAATPPRCWAATALSTDDPFPRAFMFGGRDLERYGSDAHNEIFSWPCGDPDTQWTALSADTKTANGCAVPPRGWAHTLSEHKGVLYLFGGQNYDGRTNSLYRLEMKQGGFNTPTCLWNLVEPVGEVPEARSGHSTCVCVDGEGSAELLVFGGVDADGLSLNDLHSFQLSTNTWRRVRTKGVCPPGGEDCRIRVHGEAVYVMCGVDQEDLFSDSMQIFALARTASLAEWSEVATLGTPPEARIDFATAVVGDLWLVHGGTDKNESEVLSDLHAFDFATRTWSAVEEVRGPPLLGRRGHSLLVTAESRAFLVGGMGEDDTPVATVERVSLPARRAPRKSTHDGPNSRQLAVEHLADSDIDNLLEHWQVDPQPCRADSLVALKMVVQQWLVGLWVEEEMHAWHCPPRSRACMVTHRSKVYMLCGTNPSTSEDEPTHSVFAWDGTSSAWQQVSVSGAPPRKSWGVTAAALGQRVFLFGGRNSSAAFNRLVALDVAERRWMDAWTEESGNGVAPSPRDSPAMIAWEDIHDPQMATSVGYLVVFGGTTLDGTALNDLHTFNLNTGTWKQCSPAGESPPAKPEPTAALWEEVMYVAVNGAKNIEIHKLCLRTCTWSRASVKGNPPPSRLNGAAACVFHKWVFQSGSAGRRHLDDLWTFDFITKEWTEINAHSATAESLPSRGGHGLAVVRDCLYIIGGRTNATTKAATGVHAIRLPRSIEEDFKKYLQMWEKHNRIVETRSRQRMKAQRQQAQYLAKKKQQQFGWDSDMMIGISHYEEQEDMNFSDQEEVFVLSPNRPHRSGGRADDELFVL
mmetsp:Transcript_22281/g.42515  ORF Transcript_22281/g.42515 Transcript_22281/m.42515 type:complete len:882 (-) Transcript_22281:388-3033(-)